MYDHAIFICKTGYIVDGGKPTGADSNILPPSILLRGI